MHSSLVLLFLISITLIVIMITCFICLNRSRKKEDKAFMEQVQFQTQAVARQQQQHQQQHQQHQQQQLQMSACSQSPKLVQSPSNNNLMINDTITNGQLIYQQQQQNQSSPGDPYSTTMDYSSQAASTNTGRSPYTPSAINASPYHQSTNSASSPRGPTETRSDITQQINSAIIGSSEAEFQNDFIQVFPMYQIAPQPEKNTTPYLT